MKRRVALIGCLALLAFVLIPSTVLIVSDVARFKTARLLGMSMRPPPGGEAPAPYHPNTAMSERDAIFSLLAYAVAYKGWQDDWNRPRGYNIAAVLVNADDEPVCWARNAVQVTGNRAQHAETRLIMNYLDQAQQVDLRGYRLYTTLESCAMCAGMMVMTQVDLTVYGQTDPRFGKAMERLTFDSTDVGGFDPYPRGLRSVPSPTHYRELFDAGYSEETGTTLTKWLASPKAKSIYQRASANLLTFDVAFAENQAVLKTAQRFLEGVPAGYLSLPYSESCP